MADGPANDAPYRLLNDVEFGKIVVYSSTNLCTSDNARIGSFTEIQ